MFSINNFFNTQDQKRFYTPTSIFHGENSRNLVFEMIEKGSKGIIVTDHFFLNNRFVERIAREIGTNDISVFPVCGEPDTATVEEYIGDLSDKVDWIVAVGGGSTIDTAKALTAQIVFGNYLHIGYGDNRYISDKANLLMPILIALPTTAGTGSEVSRYYLITDSDTKEKNVNRSWALCPQKAILDPYFLRNAPNEVIILGAFDAFLHLWETFICRYERTPIIDIFCLEGISRILTELKSFQDDSENRHLDFESLQLSSAMGGIALSNVRTGIIHNAGESLSSYVPVSHSESLYIFFREAIVQYSEAIKNRISLLVQHLKNYEYCQDIDTIEHIIIFWESLFGSYGIEATIREKIVNAKIDSQKIANSIMHDDVLVNKESPINLSEENVNNLVEKSISRLQYTEEL